MADIQPKNTDTIRVNAIKEKTGGSGITLGHTLKADTIIESTVGNGVRLNTAMKMLTTGLVPLSATIDIGTTTAAEHIRVAYAKALNSTGQALTVGTGSAHAVDLATNSLTRFSVLSNGDLSQNSSNGGNILCTKTSTAVAQAVASTLTAAGTTISDALALTSVMNNITTVAANTGVGLWDAPIGACLLVRNAGANTLKVYPHSASGTMNGGGAGGSVTVATGTLNLFFRLSSTDWIALEFTVAAA